MITDAPKTGSGAAFRKSDSDFVTAYNKALTDFKATDEFSAIEKKWGFRASDTDGVTTSELCKNEG